jgi:23S rRNA (guanosine2251-2'-O)-methyltransferase
MKIPLILILHNLRSMNNVGSVFRTADALGIEKIYLCGLTGCPPHREIQKTALGATETVNWEKAESTTEVMTNLKSKGYIILALEQEPKASSLEIYKAPDKIALILGNEIEGVPEEIITRCDETVFIQQFGTKKSMNVAVAGGIAAWHLSLQLRKA